jgi:hypothetical protein
MLDSGQDDMRDEDYKRYVRINLPHARTIVHRIGRTLDALGAFGHQGNGGAQVLADAVARVEQSLRPFDADPPAAEALGAADAAAQEARVLVSAIAQGAQRSDRLGQHVRNLFECLGLPEEGAEQGVRCGEHPDSPLR